MQSLTPEQQALVHDVLAYGGAASAEEAVTRALALLRDEVMGRANANAGGDVNAEGAFKAPVLAELQAQVRDGYADLAAGRHFDSAGSFEADRTRFALAANRWSSS